MDTTKAALYLRLSREDDEREAESQSISNQRIFLMKYAQEHDLTVVNIYIDDGWSGTNFERPAFQQMLREIEAGRINVVITKDLSRLGRDYIQTGHFLERYFPERQIRYIAVNDNIDTGKRHEGANDLTPFLSVINDMYAKDISKKVRTALTTKKENGRFIGSAPPMGYLKDTEERGRLVVDPDAAPIIRLLFLEYLKTGSVIGTAKCLTEQGVPTPSQYRKQKQIQKRFAGLWSDVMVKRILTNPTYAGHLTQNRTRKISYKVDKKVSLPPEEWIVVRNTHQAIVTQAEFDRVQQMIKVHSYIPAKAGKGAHLLSGLVFCADCGAPMTFIRQSPTRSYLACKTSRYAGRLKLCTSHCIREDYVEQMVKASLCQLADSFLNQAALAAAIKKAPVQQHNQQLERLQQSLRFSKQVAGSLYKDKIRGTISEAQFIEMNVELQREQDLLTDEISRCTQTLQQQNSVQETQTAIRKLLTFEPLERGTLLALVERIFVHQNKKLEILFRFCKPEDNKQDRNETSRLVR